MVRSAIEALRRDFAIMRLQRCRAARYNSTARGQMEAVMGSGDDLRVDPLLVESEARYRAVIENASDMIQSVRPNGTFEFVNRAWQQKLGYSDDDLDRLIIWDIIHPDEFAHCQAL